MSYNVDEIEGDLVVGHNIAVGGDMVLRGKATFDHDVKIKGTVEANGIKGINKGIFLSYEELLSHYPTPADGWLAGVVTRATGEETRIVGYVANEGQWVVQEDLTLNIEMDVDDFERLHSHLYVNATKLFSLELPTTLDAVRDMIAEMEPATVAANYQVPGMVLTFLGENGWETYRWKGDKVEEDWDDDTMWDNVDVTLQSTRLDNKIDLLAAGLKMSLSVSPSVIHKGSQTSIVLTGSMNTSNPVSIALFDGNTPLGTSSNNPYALTQTVTMTTNSKTYRSEGTINGMTLNAAIPLTARYPIYYGFAASKPTASTGLTKKNPTTTAAGTYAATVPAGTNGVHLYILVPDDIGRLTNFTMGGAPFVMNTYNNQTIDGVTYTIYESGNTYNAGTALSVVAS